jgi:hypothetical protein
MKKRFTFLAACLALLLFAVPAFAAYQDMHATVYRWSGNYNSDGSPGLSKATTGITYLVLSASSDTKETLYAFGSRGLTTKANAVTTTVFATDKEIKFRVDPTETNDTYVDLIVTDTAGGYSTVVKNFDKYTHTIVIDERPNILHHGIIPYAASTSEVSTGITFVADTMVHDVRTEVVVTTTAGTIDVGLQSNDADGYIKGRSIATAGYTADTGVITAGSTLDYTAASTYGALLYTAITGSDAVASGGGRSYLGHVITTAAVSNVLSYTCNTTTNSGTGFIHYWFTRMR